MINSFELKLNRIRSEFVLSLFCNSSLVAELYFDSIKNLEVNGYPVLDGIEFWLQAAHLNSFVNVDFLLNPECAQALYDLIQNLPADFTSFKFQV